MSDEKITPVERSEYMEVRKTLEEGIAEYADNILFKGVCQDLVADLIKSMRGRVAYYKKETSKEIIYDYCIGLPIDRDDYQ